MAGGPGFEKGRSASNALENQHSGLAAGPDVAGTCEKRTGISCTVAGNADRARKAWAVGRVGRVETDVVYAPTESAAKARLISHIMDAWDTSFIAAAKIARARRCPERDVQLARRSPLAEHMPPRLLQMVVHAYGGLSLKAGYREHYYTRTDDRDMLQLVHVWGMFSGPHGAGRWGGCAYFYLTELGKRVAAGEQPLYPGCAA